MRSIKSVIPSALSAFRLLAAFAFPFCTENVWIWLILVAGFSDILDGWLARKWNVVSWQGGLIDAISDKLFVLTVLIVYAHAGKFQPIWIPAVISRDLLVLFTTIYVAVIRLWGAFKNMQVRGCGKLATGGQFVLFLAVAIVPEMTVYALVFASLCSVMAAVDYGWLFVNAVAERSRENS